MKHFLKLQWTLPVWLVHWLTWELLARMLLWCSDELLALPWNPSPHPPKSKMQDLSSRVHAIQRGCWARIVLTMTWQGVSNPASGKAKGFHGQWCRVITLPQIDFAHANKILDLLCIERIINCQRLTHQDRSRRDQDSFWHPLPAIVSGKPGKKMRYMQFRWQAPRSANESHY